MTVTIEKLVFGGQGLARLPSGPDARYGAGQVAFVWNALPGEEVEIEILKKKKGVIEAVATKIITPSLYRIEPKESHWLSSSPWQHLSWEKELYWKRAIAAETYSKLGGMILNPDDIEIVTDGRQYGYRNKIEFSFVSKPLLGKEGPLRPQSEAGVVDAVENKVVREPSHGSTTPPAFGLGAPPFQGGEISLGFFERGKKYRIPAEGSLLAEPIINETAQYILNWINEQKIPIRSLKTLIIRSSSPSASVRLGRTMADKLRGDQRNRGGLPAEALAKAGVVIGSRVQALNNNPPYVPPTRGESITRDQQVIAALFLKDELKFKNYPKLTETLLGVHIYYSTHLSPASVPTKLLYSAGQNYLIANLKGTQLKFGLLSFFQINIPVFEKALEDIAAYLHPKIPVVDYYSGVGAISLPLSNTREQTFLVDNNSEAIAYANENIAINKRTHCEAHCLPAEDMGKLIEENQMIILDPPRAGLHTKLISRLLIKKPIRIIYMSCDLATHARDLKLLSQEYKITFLKLYNFFPRTPHIEGLAVLDRL